LKLLGEEYWDENSGGLIGTIVDYAKTIGKLPKYVGEEFQKQLD
jgi:hypothetical protein